MGPERHRRHLAQQLVDGQRVVVVKRRVVDLELETLEYGRVVEQRKLTKFKLSYPQLYLIKLSKASHSLLEVDKLS